MVIIFETFSQRNASDDANSNITRLGLIIILALMLCWPDWQMTSLYTRGFRVAGIVEPSNIFPSIDSKNEVSLHDLLEVETADAWNTKLSIDTKAYDHDKAVRGTAERVLQAALTQDDTIISSRGVNARPTQA